MKQDKILIILAYFLLLFATAFLMTSGVTYSSSLEENDVLCHYCKMVKSKFGHTWVVIEYGDGTKTETCSVHCASIDLALNIDKTPTVIMVGDYNTKKPIDAEKAFWVIGGTKLGVMTTRAKWAFETKQGADYFIEEFSGKNATFDEAIKASFEDMYEDIKMIRKKRKLMPTNDGA